MSRVEILARLRSWWTISKVVLVLYVALGGAMWLIDRIPYLAERSWVMVLSDDKPELLALTAAHLVILSIVTDLHKYTTRPPTTSAVALLSGTVMGYIAAFEFLQPYKTASTVVILCLAILLYIAVFSSNPKKGNGASPNKGAEPGAQSPA